MATQEHPPGADGLAASQQGGAAERDDDAIYQKNAVVGRAQGAEIEREPGTIHFAEIHNSDTLLLPDECEFRGRKIVIKKIGYSTYIDRQSHDKGRVLQDVVARILDPPRPV